MDLVCYITTGYGSDRMFCIGWDWDRMFCKSNLLDLHNLSQKARYQLDVGPVMLWGPFLKILDIKYNLNDYFMLFI